MADRLRQRIRKVDDLGCADVAVSRAGSRDHAAAAAMTTESILKLLCMLMLGGIVVMIILWRDRE